MSGTCSSLSILYFYNLFSLGTSESKFGDIARPDRESTNVKRETGQKREKEVPYNRLVKIRECLDQILFRFPASGKRPPTISRPAFPPSSVLLLRTTLRCSRHVLTLSSTGNASRCSCTRRIPPFLTLPLPRSASKTGWPRKLASSFHARARARRRRREEKRDSGRRLSACCTAAGGKVKEAARTWSPDKEGEANNFAPVRHHARARTDYLGEEISGSCFA